MKTLKGIDSLLFYSLVILLTSLAILPIYWMVVTSLQKEVTIFTYPPKLIPSGPNLQAYVDILFEHPLLQWLKNSLIISLGTAFFSVGLGMFAGYSFSRFRYKGRNMIALLILTTQAFPTTVLVIPLFILMKNTHLINTLAGVVIATSIFNIGLCTWILKGFFDSLPIDIEDAARIDGCSRIGILYRIVLPLCLPGTITAFLMSFLNGWSEFLFSYTFIQDTSKWTATLGLYSFIGMNYTLWAPIMAGAIVFAIPCLMVFLFAQKKIVHGITMGAIKG